MGQSPPLRPQIAEYLIPFYGVMNYLDRTSAFVKERENQNASKSEVNKTLDNILLNSTCIILTSSATFATSLALIHYSLFNK